MKEMQPESFAPQDDVPPRPAVVDPRLYFKPYANSPAGWMGAITNGKAGPVAYWVSAEDGECIPNAEIPGIPPDLSAEPSSYPHPTRREMLAQGRAAIDEALQAAKSQRGWPDQIRADPALVGKPPRA